MRRAAVAQMVSSADLAENLASLESLFGEASEQKAELLVLPENFAFMGAHETDKLALGEAVGEGVIQNRLSHLAKQHNLWVVAGTVPLKAPGGRVWASSLVYNNQGIEIARYDKIHLFDVVVSETETHTESNTFAPGTKPVVVDTPIGRIGLSVCYDVRFPELYRVLLDEGAELFAMVAAFTAATGAVHWHSLLRARAIENMCYMFASNQGGVHASGRETYGHSMIVNPWGEILAELEKGPGVICADIDLEDLRRRRVSFPCLKHRVL